MQGSIAFTSGSMKNRGDSCSTFGLAGALSTACRRERTREEKGERRRLKAMGGVSMWKGEKKGGGFMRPISAFLVLGDC